MYVATFVSALESGHSISSLQGLGFVAAASHMVEGGQTSLLVTLVIQFT
jgi:hypothetical protein